MHIPVFRSLLCVGWVVAPPMAWAQDVDVKTVFEQPLTDSSPLQTSGPLSFQSVMTNYRSYRDDALVSWAEANRTVEKTGGWRANVKETIQGEGALTPAGADKGAKP